MKRHGLILLGGWLLMQPEILPGRTGGAFVGVDRPVTTWGHIAAFDSATDCEHARGKNWADAEREYGAFKDDLTNPKQLRWIQATLTRCVPAEHVYPPKTKASE
jgi:hypothetical protein